MQRRDFCKLMAVAAAARALPAKGQPALNAAAGFNKIHQTYEEFCATPENQRVFYVLTDGKIVESKLDNANWTPTAWGESPELPGGSWDGVPMQAPIGGLDGEGPYRPNWDSLLQYDVPEWYRDAKFGVWAHWSPQCVPNMATGTREECIRKVLRITNFRYRNMGIPPGLAIKIFVLNGRFSIGNRKP